MCLSDVDFRYFKQHGIDEALRHVLKEKPPNPLDVFALYMQENEIGSDGSPKAAPICIHGFEDGFVVSKLADNGVGVVKDPIGQLNDRNRFKGHTTHNFFIYDKKGKGKTCLVTLCQESTEDIKSLGKLLGFKEARHCQDCEGKLGSKKGCVSPLSLLYDKDGIQWYLDEKLLDLKLWRIGVSSSEEPAGHVADVPLAVLQKILKESGHWDARQLLPTDKAHKAEPEMEYGKTEKEFVSKGPVKGGGMDIRKSEDVPGWYEQVMEKCELIEHYPVKGCFILRPWAYKLWEQIQGWFDAEIKKLEVENCYFPMFIPKVGRRSASVRCRF